MQTDEFVPISADNIHTILRERYGYPDVPHSDARRRHPRWPFPATVELWVPDASGGERHVLARGLNLSSAGVGILMDEEISPNVELSVAIHQPEATLFGKAVVRHATLTEHGNHVGLQFVYDH